MCAHCFKHHRTVPHLTLQYTHVVLDGEDEQCTTIKSCCCHIAGLTKLWDPDVPVHFGLSFLRNV